MLEQVLWQLACPQNHSATSLGLGHLPGQLLAHCGLLKPSSSKNLLMPSWGCCTQLLNGSFRQGESTDSAHLLSSHRDLASDMDLHAKDKNVTVLTPSLYNETPSTLLLMYKEQD